MVPHPYLLPYQQTYAFKNIGQMLKILTMLRGMGTVIFGLANKCFKEQNDDKLYNIGREIDGQMDRQIGKQIEPQSNNKCHIAYS